MEALDDLRARRAKSEHKSAFGYFVKAGGRHGHQGRRSAINIEYPRGDSDTICFRCDIAHRADRIERVGFWHPDHIEPSFLKFDNFLGRAPKSVRVAHQRRYFHWQVLQPVNQYGYQYSRGSYAIASRSAKALSAWRSSAQGSLLGLSS